VRVAKRTHPTDKPPKGTLDYNHRERTVRGRLRGTHLDGTSCKRRRVEARWLVRALLKTDPVTMFEITVFSRRFAAVADKDARELVYSATKICFLRG
jgi:hypothetical protein